MAVYEIPASVIDGVINDHEGRMDSIDISEVSNDVWHATPSTPPSPFPPYSRVRLAVLFPHHLRGLGVKMSQCLL